MKCGVCFKPLKSQSGVCEYCFYSADDLTALAPKAHVEVVLSPGYQAFAQMLVSYQGLNPSELQMKIYSDAQDIKALRRLLIRLYRKVSRELQNTDLSQRAKAILIARKKKLSIHIKSLKGVA